MDTEKFKNKNIEGFQQLQAFIDDDTVKYLLVSSEMYAFLYDLNKNDGNENGSLDYFKYKGKVILSNPFMVAGGVIPVRKDEMIRFNVPCVCGYYKDEKHG